MPNSKVINRLSKYILTDGFHVVVDPERSHGSYVVDAETGREYLDCYSQFASQALGWNHESLLKAKDHLGEVALHKLANSDMYSVYYVEFVEMFAEITPDFSHYFFIDGGALAVENALKAAFDWKAQKLKETPKGEFGGYGSWQEFAVKDPQGAEQALDGLGLKKF